jgi:ABC-type multidrug transport system ATPase subunit
MAKIIELKNVGFSAKDRTVVQNISIDFEISTTTALVGPSGSGKSTVLKLAAGILVPEEGEALYKGKRITQMSRSENIRFRREGAVVFQDSALWANQNLFQIMELPLQIHFPEMDKKERKERIESVIAEVGYRKEMDIRPARLSMGEQKLIAFARALLCRPSLLYLDEWTESLDEGSADRLINIVRRKQSEGASIIFVSHDMRIIREMSDFVIMIVEGKVVFKTTKEQIAADESLIGYLKMGMVT